MFAFVVQNYLLNNFIFLFFPLTSILLRSELLCICNHVSRKPKKMSLLKTKKSVVYD